MCLFIKNKNLKPKVARKDIVCYKIVKTNSLYRLRDDERGKYRFITPFQGAYVELGMTVEAKGGNAQPNPIYWWTPRRIKDKGYNKFVNKGLIHSFKTLEGAKKSFTFPDYAFTLTEDRCYIVKCIIPKGTKYYEGIFEDTMLSCYASEKLTYGTRAYRADKENGNAYLTPIFK